LKVHSSEHPPQDEKTRGRIPLFFKSGKDSFCANGKGGSQPSKGCETLLPDLRSARDANEEIAEETFRNNLKEEKQDGTEQEDRFY
jgi:hypothetical protein